jgi:hypothetical protein
VNRVENEMQKKVCRLLVHCSDQRVPSSQPPRLLTDRWNMKYNPPVDGDGEEGYRFPKITMLDSSFVNCRNSAGS